MGLLRPLCIARGPLRLSKDWSLAWEHVENLGHHEQPAYQCVRRALGCRGPDTGVDSLSWRHTMVSTLLTVGVDIAKASFTAASWVNGTGQPLGCFPNTSAGMAALAAALAPVRQGLGATTLHLVLEPTGGYELPLAVFAVQQGWQVSMPNPVHIRDWAKSRGRRAKTDPQDALLLARYGAEQPLRPWQPLPAVISELESLLRRKDDLAQLLQQERNRQPAVALRPDTARAVVASVAQVIAGLEAALQTIDDAIAVHLQAHPMLQQEARLLQSVPGVGPRNVLWLLVLLYRWQTLTHGTGRAKGLVAYVGLDPQPFESGTSVRRRATISRMGAAHLRRRLFMSALGGTRGANPLRHFYLRLVGRGKPKMVALIAAARKILVWAWAVFRTRTPFDPARAQRTAQILTALP